MNRLKKWGEMVSDSRSSIEDFNSFDEDSAIVWADNQIRAYKEAMLALVRSNSDWSMTVTDEQEAFIETMIRRAEAD